MWTPELEQELQQLESQYGNVRPAPAAPANVPYANNPAAAQKFQEGFNAEAGKTAAGLSFQDATREKIKGSLEAVATGVENMKTNGGYSPLYDNEELLFGVLPGVKPVVQFARSQGAEKLPVVGGFFDDVGKGLTNRETQKSNVGALAAQLKQIIRQPGEGVWTDKDQEFLLQILPAGSGYDTDKNIIEGLQSGTLLNSMEQYRNSQEWKRGLEQPATQQPPVMPSAPVNLIPQNQPAGAVDYREFFK